MKVAAQKCAFRAVFCKLFILTVLFQLAIQVKAQNTIIYGKAPDYIGKELIFYTIQDPILHQMAQLGTARVTPDGNFSVLIPVTNTIEIYTNLEKYLGTMVVEPGKNYRIALPSYTPRTSFEANSAYFRPAPYWLGLPETDTSDLNFAVRSFITDFNVETGKNTLQIYQTKSKEIVNEIIDRLEKKYSAIHNPWFTTLKKYRFAELEYAVNQRTPDFVIRKYFADQPIKLFHPAYQKAFETIFTDFLRKQAQTIQHQKVTGLTNSGNFSGLTACFTGMGYSIEFAELVVLKGLYDGYYTGSFTRESVIKAVETAQTAITSSQLQPVTNQIKDRLALLATGRKAPALRLFNMKKETVTLDQFRGKFVYLSFINSKSTDCQTELDSIRSSEKRLRQVLSVVSIAIDDNFEDAVKFWRTKGYTWELLNGANQNQLIINYKTSITPTFYLISPDGNLKYSPAPSPTHGFEAAFLKLLRESGLN